MGGQTTLHIWGGNIGVVSTGEVNDIQTIAGNVESLEKSNQNSIANAFKELTKAVTEDEELAADQRQEALDLLEEISSRAAAPPEKRPKRAVIGPLLASFAKIAGTAGGVANAWATWGDDIQQFFGG